MNRYLIAALYVMAGCVVTVPLKVQGNSEPLKTERCRLLITTTVKVISQYIGEEEGGQLKVDMAPSLVKAPDVTVHAFLFAYDYRSIEEIQSPCYTSHKIRAPGC